MQPHLHRRCAQRGQGMIELALILTLVSVVVVVTMMVMGNVVQNNFWNVVGSFDVSGRTPQQISCSSVHYNCPAPTAIPSPSDDGHGHG